MIRHCSENISDIEDSVAEVSQFEPPKPFRYHQVNLLSKP